MLSGNRKAGGGGLVNTCYRVLRWRGTDSSNLPRSDMTTSPQHNAAALLASPVRRRLVDALAHADGDADTPGFTAAELGAEVGLHVTTVRFHLDQLVAAGLVESAVRREGGAGRPRKVYTLAPGSLDDVDARGRGRPPAPAERPAGVHAHRGRRPGTRDARRGRPALGPRARPADPDDTPADTPGRWLSKVGADARRPPGVGLHPRADDDRGGPDRRGRPRRTAPSSTSPGPTRPSSAASTAASSRARWSSSGSRPPSESSSPSSTPPPASRT